MIPALRNPTKVGAKFIISDPKILGGLPTIAGTRIPVARIVYLVSQGFDVNELQRHYPQLSKQKISSVLASVAKIYETEDPEK